MGSVSLVLGEFTRVLGNCWGGGVFGKGLDNYHFEECDHGFHTKLSLRIEATKMMLRWDLTKKESISWNWINIGNGTNHIMRFHREIIRFKLAQLVDISRSWMIMMI